MLGSPSGTRRTRIDEFYKSSNRGFGIRRTCHIEHPEEGFGLVRVGDFQVIEHHEDLEDHAEVGADGIIDAGDGDGSGQIEKHNL